MSASGLKSITAAQLVASPPAPKGPLLSPWLKERQAVMLYAPTGAGKSQVAMSISLALAGGCSVAGWMAPAARQVLYIDGEMGMRDLHDRILMLSGTLTPNADESVWQRLHLVAREGFADEEDFPDIADAAWQRKIIDKAKEVDAALVVLDNLSTLATIEDENSASAVRGPVNLIQALRRSGHTVLLVHHSGKQGGNYRGSSNLATVLDTVIGLQPSKDAGPGVLDVRLNWDKLRDGANAATVPARLRLVTDAQGTRWESAEDPEHKAMQLARALRSRQFTSLAAAGVSIGLDRRRASEIAATMRDLGIMSRSDQDECLRDGKAPASGADLGDEY